MKSVTVSISGMTITFECAVYLVDNDFSEKFLFNAETLEQAHDWVMSNQDLLEGDNTFGIGDAVNLGW